jgi:hypothetical protein
MYIEIIDRQQPSPGEAATAEKGSVEGSGDGSMLKGSLFGEFRNVGPYRKR